MKQKVLKIHPKDNVLVALCDLTKGEEVIWEDITYTINEAVRAKHKLLIENVQAGDAIKMYGLLVGRANKSIGAGYPISTENVRHAATETSMQNYSAIQSDWVPPDVSAWKERTFMGYHRSNGSVGTANYWLVVPLVFCENQNVEHLKDAFEEELGFKKAGKYRRYVHQLVQGHRQGDLPDDLLNSSYSFNQENSGDQRVFKQVDGIRFLTHQAGCGGTRQDSRTLCGLLAGYIGHPNVAGATVLSLGCQNAQVKELKEELESRVPGYDRPLVVLEQQKAGTIDELMKTAIRETFLGLVEADKCYRKPAPLSKLNIGLECGGSDGFSGISANPAIGHTSDLIVALGGTAILSEFPELCGVEQELINRCPQQSNADRFLSLMKVYKQRAEESGSGFDMNPSPGNIKDGLITDAMKSAGAAKKGGTSPINDVLDYPEKTLKPGLNLLCTPGNDVESTTALVGAGANLVLFTTGLGTPTGNPIAPVIKISSNSRLHQHMSDIIDINTGPVIDEGESIAQAGARILEFAIKVASGQEIVKAVNHAQYDFIPWKRGVSL